MTKREGVNTSPCVLIRSSDFSVLVGIVVSVISVTQEIGKSNTILPEIAAK